MLFYTGLVFLVIAVSLDGFGVGITYGIRKIQVPLVALTIIMACSGLVVFISMAMGKLLSDFITPQGAEIFGGIILIGLGIFSFWNIYYSKPSPEKSHPVPKQNKLNSIKTVFVAPEQADLDNSGTISASEALLLGFALALDAFGAGIGASMLGYSPFITSIMIALMSGLFLYSGIRLGLYFSKNQKLQRMKFIPPILLVALGLSNIF